MSREKELNKEWQKLEDSLMESHMDQESSRIYLEWKDAPEISFYDCTKEEDVKFKNYIPLVKPKIYTVYDNDTAKYLKLKITEEVMKKVNQKKEFYLQN